jgi:4-oxalocrotonate tautomerase
MLEGRKIEQKRKLVERVTDALVEECGAPRDGISISLVEVSRENYASKGVLMADKK